MGDDDTSRLMAEAFRTLKTALAETKAELRAAEVKLAEWTAAGNHEAIAALDAEVSNIREILRRDISDQIKVLRRALADRS